MRTALPRIALMALLALSLTTVLTGVSRADEIAIPDSGSFAIEGHGWGHGRGMSQEGAQGAATLGKTADDITSFYYPGTAKTLLPGALIRVLLQEDEGIDLQVYAASGLTVTDTATNATSTLPAGPTRWKATHDAQGFEVWSLTGSTWTEYDFGGHTRFAGPVRFSGPSLLKVALPGGTSRDYRNAVQASYRGTTTLYSVAVMPLEDYLYGVVPRESCSCWDAAALQAQAVAARSYAAWKRANAPSNQTFDICDSTQCQVFGGTNLYSTSGSKTSLEAASSNSAVQATSGVVRTYQGKPIFAEFSASNGGLSTAGDVPYLVQQDDPWDGVTNSAIHSWTATISAAQIQARYPAVGTLQRLRVTSRQRSGSDWQTQGRVLTVVLEGVDADGNATSVSTTGAGIYNANSWPGSSTGLRSSWWHVKGSLDGAVVARSGAPSLVNKPGQTTGQLAVQLKNTGTQPWPTSGVHLTVAASPGSPDPLVDGSTRPGTFTKNLTTPGSDTVDVGETAEFRVFLDADGVKPGSYTPGYRLRISTGNAFGPTLTWRVPVAAPVFSGTNGKAFSTTAATGDAPASVFADGHTVVVPVAGSTSVRIPETNGGNLTWPLRGAVRLGTSHARSRVSPSAGSDWITSSKPAFLDGPAAVKPGAAGWFDLVLHGNSKAPGLTVESFEPMWDNVSWISGAVTTLNVVRVNPAVSRLDLVHSVSPTTTLRTGTGRATLHLRFRNLGGSAWGVGAEAIGVTKASTFATSAWSSSSRPPKLASNLTRPGKAAVYPGELGDWTVPISAAHVSPGTYSIGFRLVGPSGAYGPTGTVKVVVSK